LRGFGIRGPRVVLFIVALLVGVFASTLSAATPQATKVQGLLTDRSSGSPVPAQGLYSMTFVLWDSLVGGAPIRSVGPLSIQVAQGLFEVELPLGAGDFTGTERYLEIVVNAEALTPRMRLVSTPFAFQAEATNTAATAGTANLALQVAPGSVGPAALAPGAVTADKLGIPCSQGQTLVRGAAGWECAQAPSTTICPLGSFLTCFTGPPGSYLDGNSLCRAGTSRCNSTGTAFGPCTGEVLPQPETCDGIDNDCNGLVDDGFGSTTCGVGVCARTVQNCLNGVLQTCQPQPNGTPCEDGKFCTVADVCSAGSCVAGYARYCADGLACTADVCDEAADVCVYPCLGPTQFCVTESTLVTCTGSGPACGQSNTNCSSGCNAGTNACNP
jgi:hypothetical protein